MTNNIMLLILILGTQLYTNTFAQPPDINSDKSLISELKPIKKYKLTALADLSTDGRYVLLEKSLDNKSRGSLLTVIEFNSGREIAKRVFNTSIIDIHFFPDSARIIYMDTVSNNYQIWNYNDKTIETCSSKSDRYLPITFLNEKRIIGALYDKTISGHQFVTMDFPKCEIKVIDKIYPANPYDKSLSSRTFGNIAVSPDKHSIIYAIEDRMVVRDALTLKIVNEFSIKPLELSLPRKNLFTSDGKYIVFLGFKVVSRETGKRIHYLFKFDAKTYKQVDQFEVSGDVNLAVSPDGRFAAVAYRTNRREIFYTTEKARIALIDLTTGKEVAKMSQRRLLEIKTDPWASNVNKLKFTLDGKYLLTSTNDTYIWDISRVTQNMK